MESTHRVLIASQPGAWRVLEAMLKEVVDVVPAHTTADALSILERERIDLIVSTVAFDESRMIEFLQDGKAHYVARPHSLPRCAGPIGRSPRQLDCLDA